MLKAIVAVAFVLAAGPAHAAGASDARVDAWLASSPRIVLRAVPDPNGTHRPWATVAGSDGGFVSYDEAVDAVLTNGQEAMAVPLLSGGTGGAFTALLFTKLGGKTRFVGSVPSPNGHLRVWIVRGLLMIVTPVYGPHSGGECCPSDLRYQQATLRGLRLVKLKSWTEPLPAR